MNYPKIYIKSGKDHSIQRFHPWVFSGAVERVEGNPKDGDIVQVLAGKGRVLGVGHYHIGNIAVRLLAFEAVEVDEQFWFDRLQRAYALRERLGLCSSSQTNAYRLVHGEGDGFSGLILDFYNGVLIFQAHSIGMHQARQPIAAALQRLYGDRLLAIYDKSKSTLPSNYAADMQDGYIYGQLAENEQVVLENGHSFSVNWQTGQKTGFFLDQRDNRALLGHYAPGKRILNAFCYSGGFSVYGLAAGAAQVDSVDISDKAIRLLDKNLEINQLQQNPHQNIAGDVLDFLDKQAGSYDIVILDPPAYAKTIAKRHNAVQGYKRLNVSGLKRVAPGGLLFTFSCSQVVDRQLFYDTITAAAIEARRSVRVLHHLSQPADHPVNIFHPEGHYLKGLVLYVE